MGTSGRSAPIITGEQAARLTHMAHSLVKGSTVGPGARIATGENTTGRSLLTPGVNTSMRSTYPAFWTRDPAWIAGAGLVGPEEAWGWLTLLTETMNGPVARELDSGATVPPFAIADHVNPDGRPVYFPGTYDSGEQQGGPDWGLLPPHDDQYWLTFTAHAIMTAGRDPEIGSRRLASPIGEIPVWLACDLAHHALEVDASTGCCTVDEGRHQVDWGYNDSVTKTGLVLFPSLLRLESCLKLAELCARCGQTGRATALRAEATALRRAISTVFVRRSGDNAWLHSATGVGDLPDVWGTAFAVHRGFVDAELADALARSLLWAYETGAAVVDGQISHVLRDESWTRSLARPGEYQNGAYWGYPAGWYIHALTRVDSSAARRLFASYLESLEHGWNDDGSGCIFECVNPALGYRQNPGYLATVAVPYAAFREANLLPETG